MSSQMINEAKGKLERNEFFRDCLASKEIRLKEGAQVMLLRNLDLEGGPDGTRQLVNGSRGVVKKMVTKKETMARLEAERKALGGDQIHKLLGMHQGIGRGGGGEVKEAGRIAALDRQISDLRSYPGTSIPVVKFVNGAEVEILPSLFSTSIPNLGSCSRLQVGYLIGFIFEQDLAALAFSLIILIILYCSSTRFHSSSHGP